MALTDVRRSSDAPPARGAAAAGRAVFRSGLLRLVASRLVVVPPIIAGVTFLSFAVLNILPGDAAQTLLGANATPQQVARLRVELHLNEPFFTRYWHWLSAAVTGNLGRSLSSSQTVTSVLAARVPITAELLLYALVVSLLVAVPLATLAARRPNGLLDRGFMVVTVTGLSAAPYVLALVLILVFSIRYSWFPALGWQPVSAGIGPNLRSLTLPALSLAVPIGCFYLRLLRADIIEQMGEDYVVTAHAKGMAPGAILTRHALPNSTFSLITVVALNAGTLLGGTVIVEQIFGLPGIGQEMFDAISNRDFPVLEGIVVVFSVVVVLFNLLADVLYAVLDPRIRYDDAN